MTFFTENIPGRIVDTDKWYPRDPRDIAMEVAGWKYRIVLNRTGLFDDASQWCVDNLEPETFTWAGWKFYFKTEDAAAWFKLRWL
jgi:hypothetical protein